MSEQWATVELMGHAQTAGKIVLEAGLLRVDVPEGDSFRTEYYGTAAIYSIKIVSEEISRAFVKPLVEAYEYNAPIVTREQHEKRINELKREVYTAQREADELRRRLTSVNGLPAPRPEPDPRGMDDTGASGEDIPFDDDDDDDNMGEEDGE
jgi:hypothetical protein